MSVSYEYYKIFYYVAFYQSFSKASKVLMNSQPNVTRVINNLEMELGCKLFVRSNRGVVLTEAGEKLYLHVQSAHKHFQTAEEEIRQFTGKQRGYVTIGLSIGVTEVLLHNKILPILHEFHLMYPEVKMQILNESTPKLLTETAEGLTDMAIITSYVNNYKQVQSVLVNSFQDILVAGPSLSGLRERKVGLQELTQLSVVNLRKGTETYEFYKDFFATEGLVFEPEVETATTDQVLSFVANDMGVGFVSPEYAKDFLDQGKVFQVELAEEIPTRHISLIRNSGRIMNAEAEKLAGMIIHSVQEQQKNTDKIDRVE